MRRLILLLVVISFCSSVLIISPAIAQITNPKDGAIGVQGTISAPPPTVGATIAVPTNGQGFTSLPITVSGICPNDLLVKVFKNNVFAGSVVCDNGSYSLIIDLFNGSNELVARVYDALDQAGPDSNIVTVTYTNSRSGTASRVFLTSNYAKRGATPGQTLTWPIILSGGQGPYAISVDWGDGKAPDLMSQQFPGVFDIKHVYDSPGIYNMIVKATDKNGSIAFLQLVGVGNGPLGQDSGNSKDTGVTKPEVRILWQPAAIMIPLIISTFWLGTKYEKKVLKRKIEQGQRPF